MTRILGVLGLLLALYCTLITSDPAAGKVDNLIDIANIQGYYGVITLGAALVIILGGIDLSIGSVLGCGAILFGVLMKSGVPPFLAVTLVVGFGMVVGLVNGLLITQLKLQPFLVTLCGMFIFRGIARMVSGGGGVDLNRSIVDHPEFSDSLERLRFLLVGKDDLGALVFPAMFIVFIVFALVAGFFLHRTAYGRYWYAIGFNEQAARYAGVNVERQRVAVYIICSTLAAFAGVLLLLNASSVLPTTAGESKELYAILGAVLGGCSLRGGEGTAIGLVLGAMVLPVVDNLLIFLGAKSDVIPVVIGLTLLLGTIVDELIRRRSRVHR
jgi:ribose transport system permease protein